MARIRHLVVFACLVVVLPASAGCMCSGVLPKGPGLFVQRPIPPGYRAACPWHGTWTPWAGPCRGIGEEARRAAAADAREHDRIAHGVTEPSTGVPHATVERCQP